MSEDLISHRARMIPSPRSKPELIATSSLLAVIGSVDEFGTRFLRQIGGPSYKNLQSYMHTYCEVPASVLLGGAGASLAQDPPWGIHDRPDGIIVVSRNRTWSALVEVKVGQGRLEPDQLAAYHEMAKHFGFDAVVTISNEVGSASGAPPKSALCGVRPADLKKIPIVHIQWRRLLGDAVTLYRKDLEDNVADPDQDWILGQWIQYVMDERSDVLVAASLGDGWNEVIQLARKRMLQLDSSPLHSVVEAWRDVAREIAFRLRVQGVALTPRLSRKEVADPQLVRDRLHKEAVESGTLSMSWKCASPVDVLHCVVDLSARDVRYFFEVTDFAGKSSGARVMSWASQIDPTTARGVILRPKWRKPAIETPLMLDQCTGARDLSAYLTTKGVSSTDGAPVRMRIEWHLAIEGRSGRKGQEHLRQVLKGMQSFYGHVIAGLRSVETMPVQARVSRVQPDAMGDPEASVDSLSGAGVEQGDPADAGED